MWWIAAAGCVEAGRSDPETLCRAGCSPTSPAPEEDEPAESPPPNDTPPPPVVDCDVLPTGPVPYTVLPIHTDEDFDFDARGDLVYANFDQLLAVDVNLEIAPIGPGVGDMRGIQVLEDGDLLVAYLFDNRVVRIDRDIGYTETLQASLQMPNGLEVGGDGLAFVTETTGCAGLCGGQISSFDLETGERFPVAPSGGPLTYPNNLALNEAEDVLYVADQYEGLLSVSRTADGWGEPELLVTAPFPDSYDAVEVDACGNVYTIGFVHGDLIRIDPDTSEQVLLGDFPDDFYAPGDDGAGLYNSVRWGSDRGGWRRDVLYVTNRARILAVEVGVPGRSQPVDRAAP